MIDRTKHTEYFKVDIFGSLVQVVFSKDLKHRYFLAEIWEPDNPILLFIGLNPSTANHNQPANIGSSQM